jgi:type I restriction enzyme S subunit
VSGERPPLPAGWEWCELQDIAEVRLGRQRSPKNHAGDNMVPYLRAANVTWQGIDLSDVKEMNFTPAEVETYRLQPGDTLLAEASGSASEVGKPGLWAGELETCCFQNTLIRVRSEGPLPEYLLLVLREAAISGAFIGTAIGVGIHHLGAGRLSKWPVPLPPAAEQARIVAAAERSLADSRSLRQELEDLLQATGTLDRSILSSAVRGALVAQAPDDDPASATIAAIKAARSDRPAARGRKKRHDERAGAYS